MYPVNVYPRPEAANKTNVFTAFPQVLETHPERELDALLANLTHDTPWGERQIAARKLGYMREQEALPGLLAALPTNSQRTSWMEKALIAGPLPGILI